MPSLKLCIKFSVASKLYHNFSNLSMILLIREQQQASDNFFHVNLYYIFLLTPWL